MFENIIAAIKSSSFLWHENVDSETLVIDVVLQMWRSLNWAPIRAALVLCCLRLLSVHSTVQTAPTQTH